MNGLDAVLQYSPLAFGSPKVRDVILWIEDLKPW